MKSRRARLSKSAMITALALLLASALSSAAWAQANRQLGANAATDDQPAGQVRVFGNAVQMRVWARALKLTDEQIIRIRQINRRNANDLLDIEDQIRVKRQLLERTLYSNNFNEETIKQMASDIGKLQSQQIMLRIKIQLQIRQVLTPEQARIYSELRFGNRLGNNQDDLLETPETRPGAPAAPKN
jgi:Spy/CpxP family protein refolding chaperone